MKEYTDLKDHHQVKLKELNKKYNIISLLRFVMFISFMFFVYKFIEKNGVVLATYAVVSLALFLVLMRIHSNVSTRRKIRKQLIAINEDEIIYLKGDKIPFENGIEYSNSKHLNSFDLDVFGDESLFQNMNRTSTHIGKEKLSELLQNKLEEHEILENQEVIKELSGKTKWRQYLSALAKISGDNSENYNKLISWSETSQKGYNKVMLYIFYLLPAMFVVSMTMYMIIGGKIFVQIFVPVLIINLFLIISQFSKINKEITGSSKISKIIKYYSIIIAKIESEKFESSKLIKLQEELKVKTQKANVHIKKLSSLFSNLESIQNGMVAIIFNGTVLYHIHALTAILKWKKEHSKDMKRWLSIIGEVEALSSLANFSANNPDFTFPKLNSNLNIKIEGLGHPLISKAKRVCSDVSFNDNNFIILTGSNMSGKSTFLRSLGVNMILTGIGAPICSSKADIHPLNVIVSMRQSDSLSDGESYFFAEVKRLKQIMDSLDSERCFVLLDEIFRGTNSDDKQTGTIEVIKKIIGKNAIGAIATHDLEVCDTTNDYPDKLINKCFEVEIIDDELHFDYKLRDGICKNKSATFIIKKMGII
ncbi:MAG: DNA mismatch repair protein [Flavobacteriaceae bacterium]|nr:DNA mismatch repair protein [Flavobacteriaceae bacterium]